MASKWSAAGRAVSLAFVFLFLSGCAVVPFAYRTAPRVEAGRKIEPEEIGWIVPGQTTRNEIEAKFGPPSKENSSERFVAYWWLTAVGRKVILWGWLIPSIEAATGGGGAYVEDVARNDGLLIGFDEEYRVRRFEIRKLPRSGLTEKFIQGWVREAPKK